MPDEGRSRDELLELAYRRGAQLRLRRRLLTAAGAVLAVALVVGVPAAVVGQAGGGRDTRIHAIGRAPVSTTTSEEPTTAAPPTTSIASTTSSTRKPTTTTTVCRNSHNPACGPFRWDPPPGPNQPLHFQPAPHSPTSLKVGQEVVWQIVIRDPDGPVAPTAFNMDFGDKCCAGFHHDFLCAGERYGPWTPPAPAPVEQTDVERHVYSKPGTYTVHFRYTTFLAGPTYCDSIATEQNPYVSDGEFTETVTIAP